MSRPDGRSRILVVDEAIMDADPSAVFKAVMDESSGKTHWWMPSLEAKTRDRKPAGRKGRSST